MHTQTILISAEHGTYLLYVHNLICLFREIFSIVFHHYNVQLHHRELEGRNMLGKDGLIGLEGLRSSSRRRSGNSGFKIYFF